MRSQAVKSSFRSRRSWANTSDKENNRRADCWPLLGSLRKKSTVIHRVWASHRRVRVIRGESSIVFLFAVSSATVDFLASFPFRCRFTAPSELKDASENGADQKELDVSDPLVIAGRRQRGQFAAIRYIHLLLFPVFSYDQRLSLSLSGHVGNGSSGRRGAGRDTCPKVQLKNGKTKVRSNGRVVKFSCNRDYVLVGEGTSTCLMGDWTSEPPVCASTAASAANQVDRYIYDLTQ